MLESLLTYIQSICMMCNFKYIHRSNQIRWIKCLKSGYCIITCAMKIMVCDYLNVLHPISQVQILLESLLTYIWSICMMCNFKYIHRSNRFRYIKWLNSRYCIIASKMRIRICYSLNVLHQIEKQQILLESLLTAC